MILLYYNISNMTTENDRIGSRGRGDRLASASGKLLLKA